VRERVISVAVLVPVVVVVFLLGNPWLTLGMALLAFLAASEAFRLLVDAGLPVEPAVGIVAAPIAVLGMLPGLSPATAWIAYVALVVVVAGIVAFRRIDVRDGFLDWAGTSFGAIYVSLLAFVPGVLLVAPPVPAGEPLAGVLDPGRVWLVILVLLVWGFDTFAYLSGRTFRRGRFMSHISPNKTWSGVIGGLVAAMVIGGALGWAVGMGILLGVLMGGLVAVAAQSGDLAESLIKRAAGAKDSGTLIPGHGGILDRVDSFLFAAPVMYAFLVVRDWMA
jgi:phosphatidate cytidylyltransferase